MKTELNRLIILALVLATGCSTLKKSEAPSPPSSESVKAEGKAAEVRLNHKYFTISYNKSHRLANWVKYTLRKEDLNGPGVRPKRFKPDPILKTMGIKPVMHDDYTNSGFARGHLAPAEDFSRSQEAIESTFITSNLIPQKGNVNSGSWAQLERQVRSWACGEEKITVITGPVLTPNLPRLKRADISIPQEFYKIIIDETPPRKAISFIFNQSTKSQSALKNKVPLKDLVETKGIHIEVSNDSRLEEWKSCK